VPAKPSALVNTGVTYCGDNLEQLRKLPDAAFKKNGTLHLRNCAAFYMVQPHTLRVWQQSGAPIFEPDAMPSWTRERNRVRLLKIGARNNRHGGKQAEIVRLYVEQRLGLRAISRYFSGRPTTAGVRNILIESNVYRHDEAMTEQAARSAVRRKALLDLEKESRARAATCLWRLRRGNPVETTCRENGWNPKSIWNLLGRRASYRRFKARRIRKWPDKRRSGLHYSRIFPRESLLHNRVEKILMEAQLKYTKECRLYACRTRVDFKVDDGTFIECKVGMNSGQTYEFIGQACHYRLFAARVILCIPSDVRIRADLYEIILSAGATVCNEETLLQTLAGKETATGNAHIIPARKTDFVCKCCGSSEKRRYRMNSYCIDCSPGISTMIFDFHLNRWMPLKVQSVC
jgi:hypothetical protein